MKFTHVQQRFMDFVVLREEARVNRAIGMSYPWSSDPIITLYKFCNVNREHDAVTLWINKNVRNLPKLGHRLLVRNVLIARIFNDPETLRHIIPSQDSKETLRRLAVLRKDGQKLFRGAYMMPSHGNSGKGVAVEEYYMRAVDEAMEQEYVRGSTLADVAESLMKARGLGEFLANQVCTDLRYTQWWGNAPDWKTFIMCGPGTRRGLDRWCGDEPTGNGSQGQYQSRLLEIRERLRGHPTFPPGILRYFDDINNLSNCMCEWDKAERARDQFLAGERITLKKYKPHA